MSTLKEVFNRMILTHEYMFLTLSNYILHTLVASQSIWMDWLRVCMHTPQRVSRLLLCHGIDADCHARLAGVLEPACPPIALFLGIFNGLGLAVSIDPLLGLRPDVVETEELG